MKFLKKKIERKTNKEKRKKFVDKFIYVLLVFFICICLYFRLNFWQISIVAILFSVFVFLLYLGKYKLKTNSLLNKDGIKQKIETITEEETLNLMKFYYEDKGYSVDFGNPKAIISKNNHTYRLFIILEPVTLNDKDLDYIISYEENTTGKIIVTNHDLGKDKRKRIKENNIYTITKEGLINIYQDFLRNIDMINTKEKEVVELNENKN